MENWGDLLVAGVPLAAIVVGLVSFAKQVGLPLKYAPYLNGALAAGGVLLATWIIPEYPAVVPWVQRGAVTVVTFLVASGIYQLGKVTLIK